MNEQIERFVSDFSDDLTRFCIYLCNDIYDAEDLFQETWYKAIKSFDKYDNNRSFDKWLMSICVNTYKDRMRSSYNKNRFHFKTEEEKTKFFLSVPDITLEERDDYVCLHTAIISLPDRLRVILTLFYFKDYSINDIASILKIPEGTVKSRLSTAKKHLRRRLKNETKG